MREHITCIACVLQEYFTETDDGFLHERIVREVKEYKSLVGKRKKAANKRWATNSKASNGDASALQVECKSNANHKPITNNHKPETSIITGADAPPKKTGSRLHKDWKLNPEYYNAALAIKPALTDQQIKTMADGFRDYWVAKSGKDATKLDWLATWRNWVRNQRIQNTPTANANNWRAKMTPEEAAFVAEQERLELERIYGK
jgi:hypothetical protein